MGLDMKKLRTRDFEASHRAIIVVVLLLTVAAWLARGPIRAIIGGAILYAFLMFLIFLTGKIERGRMG